MPNIFPQILGGAPPTTGSGTPWGMVPQVPDPLSTANLAITGDIANLPSLTDLAGQVNQFNTGQAIAPYIANLPGYQSMVGQSSQNIGSLLRGEIPSDVMSLLAQQAAERGINTGLAGSPNANAAALRALGLTSLGLQQQGEGELTSAIGRTPVPQLFNVAQFLTTPGEEQAAQMAANIYAAAPDPQLQAQELMNLFTQFMSRIGGQGGVTTGGMPNLNMPDTIPPGGASTAPPVTVSGGGGAPSTAPQQSFWDYWAKLNQGATPGGGAGTGTGTGTIYAGPAQGAGPNPMIGPAINPSTGAASGGFQGPGINPWTGAAEGGFQGPAINPWTGGASGGYQGPAIDPWTGAASGGFQGPAIDPWTGQSTLASGDLSSWMNDVLGPGNWEDWLYGGQTSGTADTSGYAYDPFTDSSVNIPDYGSSYDPYSLGNMSSEDMASYLGLEDWYSNP